jgi:cell division septum initiation protein DivIVA
VNINDVNLDWAGLGAVLSVILVGLGAMMKTWFDARTTKNQQVIETLKVDAGTDENLRRDMLKQNDALLAQISAQSVQIGILGAKLDATSLASSGWQEKLWEVRTELAILKNDAQSMLSRIAVLETANKGLADDKVVLLARIKALEVERDALLARITVLEETVKASIVVAKAAGVAAAKVVDKAAVAADEVLSTAQSAAG